MSLPEQRIHEIGPHSLWPVRSGNSLPGGTFERDDGSMSRTRLLPSLILLVFVSACGSSSNGPAEPGDNEPPPGPDPVVAQIDGPSLLLIPVDSTVGTATYSATSSTGPIVRYLWYEGEASQPFAEGLTAERTLAYGSNYLTRLRVEGDEGQSDEDDHLARLEYDLTRGGPVIGFTTYSRAEGTALAYMHPTTREVRVVFQGLGSIGKGSWNPDHSRVVFGLDDGLAIANRDGSDIRTLVDEAFREGLPAWSPTGDWIAYRDSGHDPPAVALLYIIRPNGTGRTQVGDWDMDHSTWDPTGTRIAINSPWEIAPDTTRFRITIVTDIWGTPQRQALHTEDQILAAFGTTFVHEGANGLAWSPDGEWIVYNAIVTTPAGDSFTNEQLLVKAPADGSGNVTILFRGEEPNFPMRPTWSPDGQTVYYSRLVGSGSHIFSVPANGGTHIDLSARTDANANDSSPFYYR